ncbi:uncharacterized protein LOC143187375 [Calliopsis andreniformis]|uniref:uncharacterized protein LOC143187375 n=1 Tax=Calliopsis andreniformis TaxID=337506 RepID=UPI003FCD427F
MRVYSTPTTPSTTTMHFASFVAIVYCCLLPCIMSENISPSSAETSSAINDRNIMRIENEDNTGVILNRQKRTLLLKKKLIGAGLVGFGLGAIKGYKAGLYTAPQVHHVYLSPPLPPPPPSSLKYIEYVEKPIFVERIIERPASILKPIHVEYKDSSPYGSW